MIEKVKCKEFGGSRDERGWKEKEVEPWVVGGD